MEKVLKSGYEWCLDGNMRILDISSWDTQEDFYEESYYKEKIDLQEFYRRIALCRIKTDSMPRKTEMYLEYRMYGLVNYQLSGSIHAAIQFGHAVVDYSRAVEGLKPNEDIYKKWADEDKTFIILNGGTTNNNPERLGSLNKHMQIMRENGVFLQEFHEPDLNNALTAICFLVDERVLNRDLYEDCIPEVLPYSRNKPSEKSILQLEERNNTNYKHWVGKVGGETNAFLRKYLRNLKLA